MLNEAKKLLNVSVLDRSKGSKKHKNTSVCTIEYFAISLDLPNILRSVCNIITKLTKKQ